MSTTPSGTDRRADYERRRAAQEKVAALKGFYIHALVFAGVILVLTAIDVATGSPYWVHWVAMGWGLALVLHRLLLGDGLGQRIRRWEERKVDEYMKSDGRS